MSSSLDVHMASGGGAVYNVLQCCGGLLSCKTSPWRHAQSVCPAPVVQVMTGHSLGRNKLEHLLASGVRGRRGLGQAAKDVGGCQVAQLAAQVVCLRALTSLHIAISVFAHSPAQLPTPCRRHDTRRD